MTSQVKGLRDRGARWDTKACLKQFLKLRHDSDFFPSWLFVFFSRQLLSYHICEKKDVRNLRETNVAVYYQTEAYELHGVSIHHAINNTRHHTFLLVTES